MIGAKSTMRVAALFFMGIWITVGAATASIPTAATSRAQAVATVRGILDRNTAACRIDRVQSISAARAGAVWKVTALLVMSASGRPISETAKWNVRVSDGQATASSQLASEIENGCP